MDEEICRELRRAYIYLYFYCACMLNMWLLILWCGNRSRQCMHFIRMKPRATHLCTIHEGGNLGPQLTSLIFFVICFFAMIIIVGLYLFIHSFIQRLVYHEGFFFFSLESSDSFSWIVVRERRIKHSFWEMSQQIGQFFLSLWEF